ncbi:hypothetical protein N6H18_06235 [Reichenbachiella agarivorans]|uniref:O-antigen ligase like membrane protein n=1 Tax=Reichenbachiella agarivorans TaxID=2979464 RepID=A0ABY6CSP6_9BACT|nr:hypothetical protein [Reichenbachiella agarivorans]UXP33551.1 hypothetical protein N6H18_06235 [Reichenbachiella agarivorans]
MSNFTSNFHPGSSKRLYNLVRIWFPFLFISSVVIFPSVKGTTPAYILSFISFPFALSSFYRLQYFLTFTKIFLLFFSYYLVGQIGVILFDVAPPRNLALINSNASNLFLETSHLTQSIYLLPGFFLFLFIRYYWEDRYFKYVNVGIALLCFYGMYEWVFYFLFHKNGDFLSNRLFGSDEDSIGSFFQTLSFSGVSVLRMKSLTGEPSMFAFTLLPFWAFYTKTKQSFMMYLTLACLVLSTSTSSILGFLIFFISNFSFQFKRTISIRKIAIYMFFLVAIIYVGYKAWEVLGTLYWFVFDKITLKHVSGVVRFSSVVNAINYWYELPFFSKCFGIGFGTIRTTDMTSTLLVNTGFLGLIMFVLLFSVPIIRMKGKSLEELGLKRALLIILIVSMISVPEFSYLSLWFFLGLAYPFNSETTDSSKIIKT